VKRYRVFRALGRVWAIVIDGNKELPLPHLVKHSPDGFEYGYSGSGPSDLARSILADFLDTDHPDPSAYILLREAHIAKWTGDGPHLLSGAQIKEAIKEAIKEGS